MEWDDFQNIRTDFHKIWQDGDGKKNLAARGVRDRFDHEKMAGPDMFHMNEKNTFTDYIEGRDDLMYRVRLTRFLKDSIIRPDDRWDRQLQHVRLQDAFLYNVSAGPLAARPLTEEEWNLLLDELYHHSNELGKEPSNHAYH